MEGQHAITYHGQAVGTVTIRREGLYYRLFCRCSVIDREIHRLYADGEKLGVLILEGEELTLDTKVATKRLKTGCSFSLDETGDNFVPIRPGESFTHLDKLRSGRLALRNGEPGLVWAAEGKGI